MEKLSDSASAMMKVAADSLRILSEENLQLKEENGQMKDKLAAFEKKERAEKIASTMEEKGIQPDLSFEQKVAGLLNRENLDVIEEAVGLSAPQTKFASVYDSSVVVEGGIEGAAESAFAAALASLD